MEEDIVEYIKANAKVELMRLSETKSARYIHIAYAGLRNTQERREVLVIAKEIGCTPSYVSKLVAAWRRKAEDDVTTMLLIKNYTTFLKERERRILRRQKEVEMLRKKEEYEARLNDGSIIAVKKSTKKPNVLLGFEFSEMDELRAKAAIRASIVFMSQYGKGTTPRMNGEFFTPGTNPALLSEKPSSWLTLEAASLYCNLSPDELNNAAIVGNVERRVYKKNANRLYYEFSVDSLDKYLELLENNK